MATWMAHLRIADYILDKMQGLEATEFVIGNIAPDSGVPTPDWSAFVPDGAISHYRRNGNGKTILIDEFFNQYLTKEKRERYNAKQISFYLGYYDHLLTDILWAQEIVSSLKEKDAEAYQKNSQEAIWKWKGDWYDLDFLYLKQYPNFRSFQIYENAVGFENTYLDFFAKDAFDNRRQYITSFYHEQRDNLEREYIWLNQEQMDAFVIYAAEVALKKNYIINKEE